MGGYPDSNWHLPDSTTPPVFGDDKYLSSSTGLASGPVPTPAYVPVMGDPGFQVLTEFEAGIKEAPSQSEFY
jgi:hypothetical protein